MEFEIIKTKWHEEKGFALNRSSIGGRYIFIHFLTPVTAVLNGKEMHILPGGCVFWEKGARQQFHSDGCELVHDWFHALSGCRQLMAEYSLECQKVYYLPNNAALTRLIEDMQLEFERKNPLFDKICDADVNKLFAMLARSEEEQTFAKHRSMKSIFDTVREKIHSECASDWNISSMAQLVNMSQSSFHRNYKAIYGTSPLQDLTYARMMRAQILLTQGKYSVGEAAELCGYNNPYHFIRTFKKTVGTTPGKYRNNMND